MPSDSLTQYLREIGTRVVEDSSQVWLPSTQVDIDGMLAACFRGHAYPADRTRKVPGSAFGTSGLPDSIWVAGDTGPAGPGSFKQAQGVGLLEYFGTIPGSLNADGSIKPSTNTEYHLMEFRLTH